MSQGTNKAYPKLIDLSTIFFRIGFLGFPHPQILRGSGFFHINHHGLYQNGRILCTFIQNRLGENCFRNITRGGLGGPAPDELILDIVDFLVFHPHLVFC